MLIPGPARDENLFQDSWKNSLAFLHISLQVCAHACGLRRLVYSTKVLFMDTLLDRIVFFGRNWSRQESCSFAYTVLVAFRAEPIRMASVQTHSCVSQPCPQPVVITCLSCSSLFYLDHTPQDNMWLRRTHLRIESSMECDVQTFQCSNAWCKPCPKEQRCRHSMRHGTLWTQSWASSPRVATW